MIPFKPLFKKHSFTILLTVACVTLFSISLYRKYGQQDSDKGGYLLVRHLAEKIEKEETPSLETLAEMESLLNTYPELHAEYDTLLVSAFLQQKQTGQACALKNNQIRNDSSVEAKTFSQISDTLTSENYSLALEESKKLEAALKEKPAQGRLRAFNLFRLAFVAKKLNDTATCSEAWKTLQSLPQYGQLAALLEQGGFSLNQYFQMESSNE